MKLILYGNPASKKNSPQIITIKGRPRIIPSKVYRAYESDCLRQLMLTTRYGDPINKPINLKCLYYMQTRRRVDLVNLIEATQDILVKAGILEDDNSHIVSSTDGSRVDYDKETPRVEITITEVET